MKLFSRYQRNIRPHGFVSALLVILTAVLMSSCAASLTDYGYRGGDISTTDATRGIRGVYGGHSIKYGPTTYETFSTFNTGGGVHTGP